MTSYMRPRGFVSSHGIRLSTTGGPGVRTITNLDAANAISHPSRFTLRWSENAGALLSDLLIVTIRATDGTYEYSSASAGTLLTGFATEITLSLPPGKRFNAELTCLRAAITRFTEVTSTTGATFTTRFTMQTLMAPPTIVRQPLNQTVASGGTATFRIEATGSPALRYQWTFNGTNIAGATAATLDLTNVQPSQAGTYAVTVTDAGGSTTSEGATLTVTAAARMVNLATRGQAGGGAQALTAGFVLSGTGTKRLFIRAVGQTLSGFGLSSADLLSDPVLTVTASDGTMVATNDDWHQDEPEGVSAAASAVSAFTLSPGSKDAALIVRLSAGAYTASVSGKDSTLGLALVEVYDLDDAGVGPRLVNLATRAVVGQDSRMMIPGFVVSGTASKTYLLRGVGPGLRVFNVEGELVDPVVTLYRGETVLHLNDNWSTDRDAASVAAAATKSGAFSLQTGSGDAAFLMTLEPGAYTFQITGKNGSGVALADLRSPVGPSDRRRRLEDVMS